MELRQNTGDWGCSAWPMVAGFLFISLAGWARLAVSVRDWYWFNRFGVEPGPGYLAITGALWGVVGLGALVWVWLKFRRYPLVGMGAGILLAVTYWADRLTFSRTEGSLVSAPFGAVLTLLALAYLFWMLRPWRAKFNSS